MEIALKSTHRSTLDNRPEIDTGPWNNSKSMSMIWTIPSVKLHLSHFAIVHNLVSISTRMWLANGVLAIFYPATNTQICCFVCKNACKTRGTRRNKGEIKVRMQSCCFSRWGARIIVSIGMLKLIRRAPPSRLSPHLARNKGELTLRTHGVLKRGIQSIDRAMPLASRANRVSIFDVNFDCLALRATHSSM